MVMMRRRLTPPTDTGEQRMKRRTELPMAARTGRQSPLPLALAFLLPGAWAAGLSGCARGAGSGDRPAAPADPASLAHTYQSSLASEMMVTVLEATRERAVLVVHFAQPQVQVGADGRSSEQQVQIVRADLDRDLFVTIDRPGHVLSVQ